MDIRGIISGFLGGRAVSAPEAENEAPEAEAPAEDSSFEEVTEADETYDE